MRTRPATLLLSVVAVLGAAISLMVFAWPRSEVTASVSDAPVRVCVEVAPGIELDEKERMDYGLAAGFQAVSAGFPVNADIPVPAVVVANGCPGGLQPVPDVETVRHDLGIAPERIGGPEMHVYVYVVPEAEVYALPMGGQGVIATAYQRGCGAAGCGGQGTAIFIGR
jgi:hypothetical protein